MNAALRAQQRYRDDAVLSAPPERLVTMLYDRLLLDIERGESAQRSEDWEEANAQLQHAQAIVSELSSSLTDEWSGSAGLRSLAQSMAREGGPKGLHVAHVLLHGDMQGHGRPQAQDVAAACWQLHQQDPSTWTHELDLRPSHINT